MKQDTTQTTRYSDAELEDFKQVIIAKIQSAREEIESLSVAKQFNNPNGTDDTAVSYNTLEEGADTLAREVFVQMLARQQKFIEQLRAALHRIENKTYGICRISGKLIPRQRLYAVPHTTMCIEAKLNQ